MTQGCRKGGRRRREREREREVIWSQAGYSIQSDAHGEGEMHLEYIEYEFIVMRHYYYIYDLNPFHCFCLFNAFIALKIYGA